MSCKRHGISLANGAINTLYYYYYYLFITGAAAFVSPLQSLLGVVEQHEEELGAALVSNSFNESY